MPNAYSIIHIEHPEASAEIKQKIQSESGNRLKFINRIMLYLAALGAGARRAGIDVLAAAVHASGTVTFSGAATADDTVVINGVTFTAKASGATGEQFNIGSDEEDSAANLAAAINASEDAGIAGIVTASVSAGVVTVSAARPGKLGNAITVAEGVDAGSVIAVSAARLSGGSDGTEKSYSFGGGV